MVKQLFRKIWIILGALAGASLALIVFMMVYFRYDTQHIRISVKDLPIYFQDKVVDECPQLLPGRIPNDIRTMCIDSIRQMSKEYVDQHTAVIKTIRVRNHYETQDITENKPNETENSEAEPNAQRDALVTQAEKKGWKLIVGDPTDSCTNPTFEGEVTVHGWYVWDTFYVEKEWMLYISDEDSDKLPFDKSFLGYGKDDQRKLRLDDASKERERNLIRASKEHPREVVIRQYSLYCEGSPTVRINKQAK